MKESVGGADSQLSRWLRNRAPRLFMGPALETARLRQPGEMTLAGPCDIVDHVYNFVTDDCFSALGSTGLDLSCNLQ